MSAEIALVISCEHGGNTVPPAFADLFAGRRRLLHSHRGWDPGALPLAEALAARLAAPLRAATTTRLLIDLNRPLDADDLFSTVTRDLPADARRRIVRDHYEPYRREIRRLVSRAARRAGRVLHVGVHSFTPVRNGRRRATRIGLLYDPARVAERRLCAAWLRALRGDLPRAALHANRPYRGDDPGLTTELRAALGPCYLGVEIEVNSRWLRPGSAIAAKLPALLADTLRRVL